MKKFKLCLVGYPLKKSFSPLVFEKIAKLCNIKVDFDLIEAKDTDPGVRSKLDVPEVRLVRSKRCPQNLCINF
jgi:shikimate 5-dehydrogenase